MGTWTHPALAAADCPLAAKTLWSLGSTYTRWLPGPVSTPPRVGG